MTAICYSDSQLCGRIYVPDNLILKQKILRIHHDDPYFSHFGVVKMFVLPQQKYKLQSMGQDIQMYTCDCQTCQWIKSPIHKLHGLLASLPKSNDFWHSISMDFITNPLLSGEEKSLYNSVLIVVYWSTNLDISLLSEKQLILLNLQTYC